MSSDIEAYYLDGQTAVRHRAAIQFLEEGLQITVETGAVLWWPYEEVRRPSENQSNGEIKLTRGTRNPEVLLIPDPFILRRLQRFGSKMARRLQEPAPRRTPIMLTILAVLALVGILGSLYFWGIPATATWVASYVPASWEERLGESVVENLAPPEKRCLDPGRTQMIEEITSTLSATLPQIPYSFRIVVVNEPTVNALAAPGGYIVIYRGLIEQTQSAEELAGVLAHEMQHILHRHATRALLQHFSTKLLLSTFFGDSYGLEGAQVLGRLRYSRKNEVEADTEGMQMLTAAKINPQGMITFFEKLKKEEQKRPKLPAYISTHPSLDGRIAHLRLLARRSQSPPIKLLPGYNWKDIQEICQAKRPKNFH